MIKLAPPPYASNTKTDRQTVTTLFLTRGAPYPATTGAPLRMWQNINALATRGPVHVVTYGGDPEPPVTMPVAQRWLNFNSATYPVRKLSGLPRLAKLFRPRQFPFENDFITAGLNRELRELVDEIKPDVIVLSHWNDAYPDALKGVSAPVIVDAHNVESSLAEDIDRAKGFTSLDQRLRQWRFRRRERKLFRHAKSVWVVSQEDARAVASMGKSLPPTVVWPNALDIERYAAVRDRSIALPEGMQRDGKTIIFVAFYGYPPNQRAAQLLIDRIFPKVLERVPDARLLLVGKQPSESMRAAAIQDPRIVVTGMVDDVRPYLALGDVSAVPLTEGGGSRLKILEAFASLLPVVSTAKGAEGISAEHGKHVILAEGVDALASAIVDTFADSEQRRAMVENAFRLLKASYSWESLVGRLDEALPARRH